MPELDIVNVPSTSVPRVIASDFDGTLLRSDGSLSSRTTRAIASWQRNGGIFVVVTARPPRWMLPFRNALGSEGLALCGNGAFVLDLASSQVLECRPIPATVLAQLVDELREEIPGICFAVEGPAGMALEEGFAEPDEVPVDAPVGPIESVLDQPVGKLLSRHPVMDPDAFVSAVIEQVGDRVSIAYSGAVGLAEMTACDVTKGTGLRAWAQGHGIPAAQVWAFGDMYNDLPMLSWAGRGYAVANAPVDVQAAADAVCPRNDDDGVASVIESLLG